jgi:hypothetical protein
LAPLLRRGAAEALAAEAAATTVMAAATVWRRMDRVMRRILIDRHG